MAFHLSHFDWHEGEELMHEKLHVPHQDNPTSPFLTPYGAHLLLLAPLLALGVLDKDGRPWTTLLGGEAGFARPTSQSNIVVRSLVDAKYDPVIKVLLGNKSDETSLEGATSHNAVSALSIDLATRSRVKLSGKLVAGAAEQLGSEGDRTTEAQMVLKIERSLGNCPKYLNKKQIVPRIPDPQLASKTLPLPEVALQLLAKADLIFITSSCHGSSMSTNNRGGAPGFVRVLSNEDSGTVLVYPEYSGNRLYQSLGNLQTTPKAGIAIPDFDTGDVLYATGTTEIVIGKDAAAILPRSNLAVKINVTSAFFVRSGLAFQGRPGEPSPYNPPIRYLKTERALPDAQNTNDSVVYAKLLKKEILAPTLGRFRFSITDPEAAGRWKPGQYVALAFEDELGAGYSHMRDDDPSSLNDDLVRTFTVSSSPQGGLPLDEFEVTIRNVGRVTGFLFRQNVRSGLELPLKGFGGSFSIHQPKEEIVPFIAGGIGITPLLAQLHDLDIGRVRLFWTVNIRDLGLVTDTFQRYEQLARRTFLFVSGVTGNSASSSATQSLQKLNKSGAQILERRIMKSDLESQRGLSSTWYTCTGTELRNAILSWLPGKNVVYEDFNY